MEYLHKYLTKNAELIFEFILTAGIQLFLIIILFVGLSLLTQYIAVLIEKKVLYKFSGKADNEIKNEELIKRVKTIIALTKKITYAILWTIAIIIILEKLGINIGPIIATAGVMGLVISFGAQNLVKDLISGLFIILENQIRVGDVAIINGTGGLVESINLRTIVLRDASGVVHIFPNGAISAISNMTCGWSAYVFDIGISYDEDIDKVESVMSDVLDEMRNDKALETFILEPMEIMGVENFADSGVIIRGRVKTQPSKQWQIAREYRKRLKKAFDKNNIVIPFPQRTVYLSDASKIEPTQTKIKHN